MKVKDLTIGLILFVLSCLFFIITFSFPTPPVQAAGPAFWPRVMAVLLAFFSLALTISSVRKKSPVKVIEKTAKSSDPSNKRLEKDKAMRPIVGMITTGFFVLALYLFGFILGTVAYFILITVIISQKYSWKKFSIAIVQASVLVVAIYFIFGEFLNINLPGGIFFN